ncbi:MAG: hypothetical protein ACD_75C00161G0008 [uncultured bacterium]|nr:MAG: hypothetical protein ACD_75C00161G0008 [uncultured bacterium]
MFVGSTRYLLEILAVLLGQLLLIGALLVQRHRRGRAEEALRISNETLERRVADRTAQLRANEDRYHALFNSMTEGFALHQIICDDDGKPVDYRFLEINPAFERLTGLKRETVTGKTVRQIMPAIEPYWVETYGRVALGGKPVHIENFSAPLNRWFEVYAYQTIPGFFAVFFTDITERKRAQEALEQSNQELEQFAYVASHDLQEPLRAIVGFLQLLQSRYEDKVDEKGQHYIDRTVKAAHRMQTLIRELLTLSRVNSKGSTFLPTDFNLLVRGVLDNLHATVLEKKAEVTCGPLPTLQVDAGQIRSLFQNLLFNALCYNESPRPLINIDYRELDDSHRFQVQDNGIGIAPQFHQRIFIVFQRLHTESEYPGTGMGLALCKKIIERHGGTIWVESNPSGGSSFYFTLPKEV